MGGATNQRPNLAAAIGNAIARSLKIKPRPAPGGGTVKTLIESFRYPRRGPGMMWEAAARRTRELGGDVRLGRQVEKLAFDAETGLWTVTARAHVESARPIAPHT